MYCREQFLKSPPRSQPIESDNDSDVESTGKGKRKGRRRKKRTRKESVPDDPSNWITDNDDNGESDADVSPGTLKELCALENEVKLMVMEEIFNAQTDEVKKIIIGLHKLQIKRRKANRVKKLTALPTINLRKNVKKRFPTAKKRVRANLNAAPGTLQNNAKILARIQRFRRRRRRNKKGKKRGKFPRRKRRGNGKSGNRQFRKRVFRAQKLFQKGVFLAGGRLLEEVCKAVRDANCTATSFCNNNTHALSKVHRKQIALYEKIEGDLHRLDIVRQERADAAEQRQTREQEKLALRQLLKNRIEMRAAEQLQKDERRKERRAARKQRALERKIRRDQARAELLKYSVPSRAEFKDIVCNG